MQWFELVSIPTPWAMGEWQVGILQWFQIFIPRPWVMGDLPCFEIFLFSRPWATGEQRVEIQHKVGLHCWLLFMRMCVCVCVCVCVQYPAMILTSSSLELYHLVHTQSMAQPGPNFLSQGFLTKILKHAQRSQEWSSYMQTCVINLDQVQIGQEHDSREDCPPQRNPSWFH